MLSIAPVPGLPLQKNIIFTPRFTDRTYVVKFRSDLATGTTQSDSGSERTVTDPNATGAKKFYQVEITKP